MTKQIPAAVSLETFFADYGKAIDRGTAAAFVGAGLSVPAGFVDWRRLLRTLASEIRLDIDIEDDLVMVAQYHLNANNNDRSRLNQILVDEFAKSGTPTSAHLTLARLPIRTYWTTNYDRLLEQALAAVGRQPDVKSTTGALTVTPPASAAVVYKMHGDLTDPSALVITKDDFETYSSRHPQFRYQLAADLASKNFIFLGLGFADPNLDYVLGLLRSALGSSPRAHYTFARQPQLSDYPNQAALDYSCNKLNHRISDLKRYGIHTVVVQDYGEIPAALEELERRYYRRQVFISGAASSFEPLGQERIEALCRDLGARLISDDYNLVSGLGLRIGGPVVMGALEVLYSTGDDGELERRLRLRPFRAWSQRT